MGREPSAGVELTIVMDPNTDEYPNNDQFCV